MKFALAALGLTALAGCVSMPSGPGVMVLPGSTKTFDQFRADDNECRGYAFTQSGGRSPEQVGNEAGMNTAAVGALVGAAAGAAIGGSGHAAAAGAGIGAMGGALAGTGTAAQTAHTVQGRYDIAFQQCMYAKGHKIPMSAAYRGQAGRSYRQATPPPPPPPSAKPPT